MVAPAPSPTAMWHPGHGAPTPTARPFRFGDANADDNPGLPPGTIIGGRYRVVRELGCGGMGRVYEAEHVALANRVAIKVLRGDRNGGERLARFRQEAEATSRIGHPAIVGVSDFGTDGDRPYMVMELLDGCSFEDWLSRPGTLEDGLASLAEICRGLAAAHAVGIVHRDVKPGNVFLHRRRAGGVQIKLLDFGIAKVASTDHTAIATSAGMVLGTPYYLAPERALGRPLDPRADLYSVGVMLYELLTGTVPFVDRTFAGVLTKHVGETPLDPRQAAPERGIPDAVARLAMRLLAKQPDERGADAATLAEEIEALRREEQDAILRVVTGPRSLGRIGESTVDLDALADRPTAAPVDDAPLDADVDARSRANAAARAARSVAAAGAQPSGSSGAPRTLALGSNAMAAAPAPIRGRSIPWWVPPAIAAGLLLVGFGGWTLAPRRTPAAADAGARERPAPTGDTARPTMAAPGPTVPRALPTPTESAPARASVSQPVSEAASVAPLRPPSAKPRPKPRKNPAPSSPPAGSDESGPPRPPPLK